MTITAAKIVPRLNEKVIQHVMGSGFKIEMFSTLTLWEQSFSKFYTHHECKGVMQIENYTVHFSETSIVSVRDKFNCVRCETTATHFVVYRPVNRKSTEPSNILFFHVLDDYKIVLHTKDHIIPQALTVVDYLPNYQNMCSCCNREKGSTYNNVDKQQFPLFTAVPQYIKGQQIELINTDDMTISYEEFVGLPIRYKRRTFKLNRSDSVRIYRGGVFNKANISVMDRERYRQLMDIERYFIKTSRRLSNLSDRLVLPWYLKPFKSMIIQRLKTAVMQDHQKHIRYYENKNEEFETRK